MIQKINRDNNPREVAVALTKRIFDIADVSSRPIRVALSGGSTPESLFRYWSEIPEEIIRRGIHFWWVDERMVPAESLDSNYGNAYRQFFTPVNYPSHLLHPISYDSGASTAERAQAYDKEYRGIDIVILGMGSDGHTSSLFPGQELFDVPQFYIASVHPTNGIERVALSYKGIEASPIVFFHILGADKRRRLQEVITLSQKSRDDSKALPAAYVMNVVPSEIFTDLDGLSITPPSL